MLNEAEVVHSLLLLLHLFLDSLPRLGEHHPRLLSLLQDLFEHVQQVELLTSVLNWITPWLAREEEERSKREEAERLRREEEERLRKEREEAERKRREEEERIRKKAMMEQKLTAGIACKKYCAASRIPRRCR